MIYHIIGKSGVRDGRNISIAALGFFETHAVSASVCLRKPGADGLRLSWAVGDRSPEFVRFLGWVHQIE